MWRACERFGIRPDDVAERFEDCDLWMQANIIAYSQIREIEENDRDTAMAGGKPKGA